MDIQTKNLIRYAEDGTFYLLSYTPTEHFIQADYIAAETVAKLTTLLADKDLVSLVHIVSGLHTEVRPPWLVLDQPSNHPLASFTSWLSRPGVEFPSFRRTQGQVDCGCESPLLPVLTLRSLLPTLSPSPHAAEAREPGYGRRRHKPGLRVDKTLAVVSSYVRNGPDRSSRRWDGS
jgi:hypothetical protein